jgi:hypothetical protein
VAALLALAAAGLAFVEPVETVRSDAALTLVAAQALVEHGTLALDPYRGDPRRAYDLERDYRVRRLGGSLYYFAPGAQVLAVPFVALARGFGLDMLRPGDEAAVQNVVSALLIGVDLLLLFLVLRRLVAPPVALVITAVTVFGSPLMSTLATSLWGAGFAVPLLLLALRLVVRHATGERARLSLVVLPALAVAAFLCRPAAGFFIPALAAYVLVSRGRLSRRALALGLAAVAFGAVAWPLVSPHVPAYYHPSKLWPQTPLVAGLYGVLLSPSRGLIVFCPFLLPVGLAWAVAWARGARPAAPLPRERALAACAWTWLLAHVLLTALKGNWWGGYSYGPRLLTEVLPATAVLTALAWRRLAGRPSARALGVAYGALAVVAVGLHSGQGLFNPAAQAWNRAPDPGAEGRLVLWWRYPQFLATEAAVRERDRVWQERRLEPLRPGDAVRALSRQAVFVGWHPYEIAWRPSPAQAAVRFRPAGFDARADYVLELRTRVAGTRGVTLRLDGREVGRTPFTPPEPHTRRFVVPGAWLQGAPGERELGLEVDGAARAGPGDARVLGLDFHGLRFTPLPPFHGRVGVGDEALLAQGFADAESGGHWTRDERAEILLPLPADFAPAGAAPCRLELEAAANGAQTAEPALDGTPLARWAFDGFPPQRAAAAVERASLRPGRLQRLTLRLPQARALPSDPRRLGLYVVGLSLTCP